ncbi:hypothetical protein GOBAR_DD29442 [Gossypium barbadense]|nr:hypothetical protein GOBAR_DD29442 [Gossypium barbadense]
MKKGGTDLVAVIKHLEIILFISTQFLNSVSVLQESNERSGGIFQSFETSDNLDSPIDHVLRDIIGAVQALMEYLSCSKARSLLSRSVHLGIVVALTRTPAMVVK